MPIHIYLYKDPEARLSRVTSSNPKQSQNSELAAALANHRVQKVVLTDDLPSDVLLRQLGPLTESMNGQAGNETIIDIELGS